MKKIILIAVLALTFAAGTAAVITLSAPPAMADCSGGRC